MISLSTTEALFSKCETGLRGMGRFLPIPVTVALAISSSPTLPAGFTNEVPMSTETPVMYCRFVATASDPRVSVRLKMYPP